MAELKEDVSACILSPDAQSAGFLHDRLQAGAALVLDHGDHFRLGGSLARGFRLAGLGAFCDLSALLLDAFLGAASAGGGFAWPAACGG